MNMVSICYINNISGFDQISLDSNSWKGEDLAIFRSALIEVSFGDQE